MCGIQALKLGKPERGERGVRGGLHGGLCKLGEEILGSVVGEAGVNGDKLFIENGSAEEAGHLLFFDLVSRECQGVADAGKDKTGDVAFEGLKEHEFSTLEGEDQIAMTELDAVGGGDGVNVIGIEAERVERSEDVTRRIRRIKGRAKHEKNGKEGGAKTHPLSVVTFGMRGQGSGKRASSAD